MCGFRVYPLATTVPLLERARLGSRMDFDIEILVRLHWLGVPLRWVPTTVSYPPGGASHFRLRLDNALITRAHTVLFFGMLLRTPVACSAEASPGALALFGGVTECADAAPSPRRSG